MLARFRSAAAVAPLVVPCFWKSPFAFQTAPPLFAPADKGGEGLGVAEALAGLSQATTAALAAALGPGTGIVRGEVGNLGAPISWCEAWQRIEGRSVCLPSQGEQG